MEVQPALRTNSRTAMRHKSMAARAPAEQSRQLDTLLVQEKKAGYLAERAFFYSGLSVGIGLGRL